MPSYKLAFDFPNLMPGTEIQITGLPFIFKNGGSYEITPEAAEAFSAAHRPVVSYDDQSGGAKYDDGPTLEEYFAKVDAVQVTKGGDE